MESTTAVFVHVVVTLAGAGLVGYVVDARAKRREAALWLHVTARVDAAVGRVDKAVERVDAALKAMATGERTTPVSLPPEPTRH